MVKIVQVALQCFWTPGYPLKYISLLCALTLPALTTSSVKGKFKCVFSMQRGKLSLMVDSSATNHVDMLITSGKECELNYVSFDRKHFPIWTILKWLVSLKGSVRAFISHVRDKSNGICPNYLHSGRKNKRLSVQWLRCT